MNSHQNLVVVTGASRGIGAALVAAYAARDAEVIAVSRAPMESRLPGVTPLAADLGTEAGIAALSRAVEALGRPVDVLINNAGIQNAIDLTGPVDPALIDTEIAVNLAGPIKVTLALMPFLRAPGASVVNVTSLTSRHPKPSAPVYSATKAGLASFTGALRLQLAARGIAVTEAVPPLVDTDMTRGRGRGKLSPDAMAGAILRGVERRDALVAPRKSALVLRLNRVFPGLVARILAKG